MACISQAMHQIIMKWSSNIDVSFSTFDQYSKKEFTLSNDLHEMCIFNSSWQKSAQLYDLVQMIYLTMFGVWVVILCKWNDNNNTYSAHLFFVFVDT